MMSPACYIKIVLAVKRVSLDTGLPMFTDADSEQGRDKKKVLASLSRPTIFELNATLDLKPPGSNDGASIRDAGAVRLDRIVIILVCELWDFSLRL